MWSMSKWLNARWRYMSTVIEELKTYLNETIQSCMCGKPKNDLERIVNKAAMFTLMTILEKIGDIEVERNTTS